MGIGLHCHKSTIEVTATRWNETQLASISPETLRSFCFKSYISVSDVSDMQEQERVEQGVSQQQKAQEAERLLVLEKVRQAEDGISSRISNMLMDKNR